LVADQPRRFVDFVGVAALDFEIGLGTSDKEAACLAQSPQTLEIDIAAIHHVESPGLGDQLVEHVDFVPLAIADTNERRDIASQVQQRVQLDSGLGRTERRPRKNRKAQIDGGGVQSVNGVFQLDSKRFVDVEPSCHSDQTLSEVAVDAPIPSRVGVGQGIARYSRAKTQVIALGRLSAKTSFDIAQALAIR